MALDQPPLSSKQVLVWFVIAHHFFSVTACDEAFYVHAIENLCLVKFQGDMEALGQRYWCDWDETVESYKELTNCTYLVAEELKCYWPNQFVDEFFIGVHKFYFRNCSLSGRSPKDPPNNILGPMIVVPIIVTLLMTVLVVWRSKRSEGIV
ncbi:receptor activity-modifying protein 1 isoform X2 [Polypterus senegalus]|uniref:receptor activity-modifying protein 1 isoform X2 n=1 Tax=Polypterus senegalus TaxID=55291 RepID=UPI0019658177|nr:receptor activity-modifying protein 1 isoform X2 [Polypterus senegalus]